MNEHVVAFADVECVGHQQRGQARAGEGGGGLVADVVGDGHKVCCREAGSFGPAASVGEEGQPDVPEDALSEAQAGNLGTEGIDGAGDVHAGDDRGSVRESGAESGAQLVVRGVDAGGRDADANLPGVDRGVGEFPEMQNVRAAELVIVPSAHFSTQPDDVDLTHAHPRAALN